MSEEIKVMLRPEWITWENIRECIYLAQQTNLEKGFDMNFGHYSAAEIEKEVGDGMCFVALNKENKVIATCSYKISQINRWWSKGQGAYLCLAGVHPDYQGKKIYSALCKKREEHIVSRTDVDTIWFNTAEHNYYVQKKHALGGFVKVQLSPSSKGANYYSVIMAKYLNRKPLPQLLLSALYYLSFIVVKILYKPGKIRRI